MRHEIKKVHAFYPSSDEKRILFDASVAADGGDNINGTLCFVCRKHANAQCAIFLLFLS